ncbi:hypothetical protein M1545_03025 [Patescibacteria group bacterium]|nr:hypothetical protein [Patescibacteria group bacterium]
MSLEIEKTSFGIMGNGERREAKKRSFGIMGDGKGGEPEPLPTGGHPDPWASMGELDLSSDLDLWGEKSGLDDN